MKKMFIPILLIFSSIPAMERTAALERLQELQRLDIQRIRLQNSLSTYSNIQWYTSFSALVLSCFTFHQTKKEGIYNPFKRAMIPLALGAPIVGWCQWRYHHTCQDIDEICKKRRSLAKEVGL